MARPAPSKNALKYREHIVRRVDKAPSFQDPNREWLLPYHLYTGLNTTVAEINHNETSIIVLDPAPGYQVLKRWIASALAQF